LRVSLVGAAGVGEEPLLRHVAQHRDMAYVQWGVDGEARVEAAHAVLLRADGDVMPGAEVLDMHPGRPRGGVDAVLAGRLELFRRGDELLPGLRGDGLEACFLESAA